MTDWVRDTSIWRDKILRTCQLWSQLTKFVLWYFTFNSNNMNWIENMQSIFYKEIVIIYINYLHNTPWSHDSSLEIHIEKIVIAIANDLTWTFRFSSTMQIIRRFPANLNAQASLKKLWNLSVTYLPSPCSRGRSNRPRCSGRGWCCWSWWPRSPRSRCSFPRNISALPGSSRANQLWGCEKQSTPEWI